jgi:hypothetical protein
VKSSASLWLAALYCVAFIDPLWHPLCGLVCDCNARWLWHLPACIGTVLGNTWGMWTYRRRGQEMKLIAELRVKQTLKK